MCFLCFFFVSFLSICYFFLFWFLCFCFILFCYYFLDACFVTRDREVVDSDGGGGGDDLGEVGGGEIVIRIYNIKNLYPIKEN